MDNNLKCSYENGPCINMANNSHDPESTKRSGIFALSNRIVMHDPNLKFFHMGFALKGSPDPRVPKAGVMLNFCPWCGEDLMKWLESYRSDIKNYKQSLSYKVDLP